MANVTSLDFSNATVCLSKSVTTASGAATTLGGTNRIDYSIGGILYTKAAFSSTATPTSDYLKGTTFASVPLAINTGSVFVIALDSSSNLKCAQGTVEALDSAGNFINAPQFPEMPTESASFHGGSTGPVCPVCYIMVKNGATGSAWTFGTSNWNATGATVTVKDIMALPGRPQVA